MSNRGLGAVLLNIPVLELEAVGQGRQTAVSHLPGSIFSPPSMANGAL